MIEGNSSRFHFHTRESCILGIDSGRLDDGQPIPIVLVSDPVVSSKAI